MPSQRQNLCQSSRSFYPSTLGTAPVPDSCKRHRVPSEPCQTHEQGKELHHHTSKALANLAETAASDRAAVTNLSTVNTDLF
eukprot:5635426-Ditylum_brightwellii.AAC.1